MSESPLELPEIMNDLSLYKRDNLSELMPYFSSKSIEVLREEEAYPIGSLVADVGGVLGLFIGFNFLMFWDLIVWGIEQIQKKLLPKSALSRSKNSSS